MASEDAFLSFSPREPLCISEGGDKGELIQPGASWEVLPCLQSHNGQGSLHFWGFVVWEAIKLPTGCHLETVRVQGERENNRGGAGNSGRGVDTKEQSVTSGSPSLSGLSLSCLYHQVRALEA